MMTVFYIGCAAGILYCAFQTGRNGDGFLRMIGMAAIVALMAVYK